MHSEAPAMGPTGEQLSHSLVGPSPIGHGTQAPAQLTEVWANLSIRAHPDQPAASSGLFLTSGLSSCIGHL